MDALLENAKLSSAAKATYISHLTEEVGGKTMSAGAFSVWFFLLFISTLSCIIIRNGIAEDISYSADAVTVISVMIFAAIVLLHILFASICMARRLNDIGVTTARGWLILIPVIGYVYCLYLCFAEPHY